MTPPKWAPPVALVSAVLLIGVMAEVTKPAPERIPAAIVDETKNDAPMEVKSGDNKGTRGVVSAGESGIEAGGAVSDREQGRSVYGGAGVADRAPKASAARSEVGARTEASAKVASVVPAEIEDQCPTCTRCLRPCTATPHTSLQCSDARVAAWKLIPTVWEIWCLNGTVEQRELGAWPEPVIASAKMEVQGEVRGSRRVGGNDSASQRLGLLATGDPVSGTRRDQAAQASATVAGESSQAFGWYVAQVGDRYCPRSPKTGHCDDPQPATAGATYLTYARRLTHVTLRDCGDEHVLEAISQHWPNVFCIAADGKAARYNADDVKLTPIRVFSDHDRIGMGRVTEVAR